MLCPGESRRSLGGQRRSRPSGPSVCPGTAPGSRGTLNGVDEATRFCDRSLHACSAVFTVVAVISDDHADSGATAPSNLLSFADFLLVVLLLT